MALAASQQQPAAAASSEFANLEGRVTDASGQPIPRAGLTLTSRSGGQGQLVYRTISGLDGAFSFPAIEPGTYSLLAERSGYQPSYFRAGVRETFSQIELAAGGRARINLRMRRSATISGRVLDADGDPVRSAQVRLLRRAFQPGFALTPLGGGLIMTDQSGRYAIPDLSPGAYYLCAGADGYDRAFLVFGLSALSEPRSMPTTSNVPGTYYANTYYPGVVDQASAKAIRVQHDDISNLDIILVKTQAFRVSGRVAGIAPGHPLEQCRVTLAQVGAPVSMTGPSLQGTTDQIGKDGTFDFGGAHFPPGEYYLAVTAFAGGRNLVLAREHLRLADRDIRNSVLALQPLVQLHGKFVVEGEPQTDFSRLPGVPPPTVTTRLGLSREGDANWGATSSNITSDGSFTIGEVAPGTYDVHVSGNPGGTWVKSIRFGSREAAGGVIDVTGASATEPIQVLLSHSMGAIDGMVRTKSGAPAAGSTVIILRIPLGKTSMLTGTDDNGEFTMPAAPGQYRLYAWEDLAEAQRYDPSLLKDHEGESVTVTLREGGRERVTLTAIPAGSEGQ